MEYYHTVSASQDMITEHILEAASLCKVTAVNIPKENQLSKAAQGTKCFSLNHATKEMFA